jgi:hypothetical protein
LYYLVYSIRLRAPSSPTGGREEGGKGGREGGRKGRREGGREEGRKEGGGRGKRGKEIFVFSYGDDY